MKITIGNPFPSTLKKDCERASVVLADFVTQSQEKALVSDSVIQNCKGLVFLSLVKGAYIWSGRFGSGFVIAKLDDGSWSAPSSLGVLGVGYGAQAGLQFTDCVIILKDDNSLNAFMQMGNVTFGANLGLSLLLGRELEVFWAATCGLGYSFSKSKGLFGGLSLEATLVIENSKANKAAYGRLISAKELLSSQANLTEDLMCIHTALYSRFPYPLQQQQEQQQQQQNMNSNNNEASTSLSQQQQQQQTTSNMYPVVESSSKDGLNPPSYTEMKTVSELEKQALLGGTN